MSTFEGTHNESETGQISTAVIDSKWARIGGWITVDPTPERVDVESLIVDSSTIAHAEPRIFWIMASWLAVHHKLVNFRRLGRMLDEVRKNDELGSATAGAVADVATSLTKMPKAFDAIRHHSRPLSRPRPLFDIVAQNKVLATFAEEDSLAEFSIWGLWENSISDKRDAIRPITWLLRMCPEFHMRSLLGADLEASVIENLRERSLTVADLARATGSTRPAVQEVVESLIARGVAKKAKQGYRRCVTISNELADWFDAFPTKVLSPTEVF